MERMGKETNTYSVLVGKLEGKSCRETPWLNRRIILKWILKIGWENVNRIHLDWIGRGGGLC